MTEESYIEDVIRPNLLQTKLAEAVAAQDTEGEGEGCDPGPGPGHERAVQRR